MTTPFGELDPRKIATIELGKDREGNTKTHTIAANLFKKNYTPFFSAGLNVSFATPAQTQQILHDFAKQLSVAQYENVQPVGSAYVTNNIANVPSVLEGYTHDIFDYSEDDGELLLKTYKGWLKRRKNYGDEDYQQYVRPNIFIFDFTDTETIPEPIKELIMEISLYGREYHNFSIIGAQSFFNIYPGDYVPTNVAWFGSLPDNYSTLSHRPSVIGKQDDEVMYMPMYGMGSEYVIPRI